MSVIADEHPEVRTPHSAVNRRPVGLSTPGLGRHTALGIVRQCRILITRKVDGLMEGLWVEETGLGWSRVDEDF